MNALRAVFSAFANLAAAINGLTATITVANDRLREQIDLSPPSAQLDHAEVIENGDSKRRIVKTR